MDKPPILEPGEPITITYYEGNDQIVEPGWQVVSYDDGIARIGRMDRREFKVINLRSHGFLSAKID